MDTYKQLAVMFEYFVQDPTSPSDKLDKFRIGNVVNDVGMVSDIFTFFLDDPPWCHLYHLLFVFFL